MVSTSAFYVGISVLNTGSVTALVKRVDILFRTSRQGWLLHFIKCHAHFITVLCTLLFIVILLEHSTLHSYNICSCSRTIH
jgi:hypothetical protein